MAEKILTKLLDILRYSTELMKSKNIDDARLNAELMLCDTLNCDRVRLYLDFDKPLTKDERDKFKSKLLRRLKGEPLQYILGYTEFFDTKIFLNKDVLIPRPETEELVNLVLVQISKRNYKKLSIYEQATGSGCISIALAKALEKKGITDFNIYASDISEKAIEIAKKNAEYNQAKNLKFFICDFLNTDELPYKYNIFIMNPPYVSESEYAYLDNVIRDWEPINAVTDFNDGLNFYRKLSDMMSKGKLNTDMIFCEIGYNQAGRLKNIMTEKGIKNFKFFKDMSGNDRILFIENESGNTES